MLWRNNPRRGLRIVPPGFIEPCAPTVVPKPPIGEGWVHEIKHDGYRLMIRKSAGRVTLFTRRGFDWTARYPQLVAAAEAIKAASFLIDGEAVCAGDDGVTDFSKLHSRVSDHEAFVYGFDLLELDGEDLKPRPLLERKVVLQRLLKNAPHNRTRSGPQKLNTLIQFVEHSDEDGPLLFRHACKLGLEGIVSKRIDAPYRPGKSRSWLKTKNPLAPAVMRLDEGG
jgi:bifunctional non-homologous end joining protein LigD